MNKEMEYKVVPKLRFPEFREAGEWEEKRLEEVATLSKGKGISKSDITPRGSLPCIRYGELYTHYGETINSIISYTNVPPTDLVISQANDVIIPASGETKEDIATASCVLKSGVALGGDLNIVRSKLNGVFLSYYLNNVKKQEIAQLAQGISVVHLYPGQLKKLNINAPKPKEQQKIADCLSSLDDLIAAQSQKLDALKTHKKGLMQQLFPGEGETVPRLRFAEFRDAGEWSACPLGGISRFSSGGTPSKEVAEYWGGSIPWISASSMYDTKINKSELNVTALAIGNGTRIAKKGSLLILVRGSMLFNRVPIGIATIDLAFNQDVKALEVNANIFETFLLYQLISFESRIPINETGIGAGKIETDDLKNLIVFIPTKTEQQKIADCLSSLDELITAQSQKLDALKTHKKGLMQQLFPNPNELD